MSIYASIFDIGEEHLPRCLYRLDDSMPCTCGESPLLYQGSHVLPSKRDKRGGCLMLAAIPNHITRDGRDNGPQDGWYPWMRVSMFEANSDSLILTRKQVEKLRDSLSQWLENAK